MRSPELYASIQTWVLKLVDKLSIKIAMKLILGLAEDKTS